MRDRLFKSVVKRLSGHGLSNNPLISKAYKAASKKMLPEFIDFEGSKLFLDSSDATSIAVNGYADDALSIKCFKEQLKNDSVVVVDVGANVGIYTLIAAKSAALVHSFEPDPISFANLEHNVKGNGYSNVALYKKAASDRTGQAGFYQPESNLDRTSNYIVESGGGITIDTVKLDDVVSRADLIKMDVEGSEYHALRGMERLLKANKPTILMEYNPKALMRMGVNLTEFVDYLFTLGYSQINRIDEKLQQVVPTDKKWLICFATSKDNINLLLLP